jgi:hypothetical protein
MTQLTFPFAADDPPPAVSRTTRYWRSRIDRAVAATFELGRRARKQSVSRETFSSGRPKAPRSLGAAVVPPVRPAYVDRDDRNELAVLAKRIERLTISRRDPEAWHIEKSEISAALRQIARRS